MKEQYFKVKKELAARAGLDSRLRKEVDGDCLMLSEKDIRMISLSFEEKLEFLNAQPVTESDLEPDPADSENQEPETDDENPNETEVDENETEPEETPGDNNEVNNSEENNPDKDGVDEPENKEDENNGSN